MSEHSIGDRIDKRLKELRWTQRKLGEVTGLTEASISRYVWGSRTPNTKAIVKIANALDVSADYLLGINSVWVPSTESLPEPEDMYKVPERRYLVQMKAYGLRRFIVCSRLKHMGSPMAAFWDWYGRRIPDNEVEAWMQMPDPWRGEQG